MLAPRSAPLGFTAIGVFWFFGAAMAALAAFLLLAPGMPIDRAWALNPEAQRDLSAHGRLFGPGFLLLSAALLGAGFGWFKRRLWGWRLAIFIVATQVAGGLAHVLTGYVAKGIVGTIIPGALLFYLLRPRMKTAFGPNDCRQPGVS